MIVNLLMLIAGCVLISFGAHNWFLGIGMLCVALVILNGIGNVMRQMPKPMETATADSRLARPASRLFPTPVGSKRPDLN
ncbi:MAG: hypothetical protein LAP85_24365 [Acidobacteriia bacterium]|nr:hypothetical protein [Terriglobia bacterium]